MKGIKIKNEKNDKKIAFYEAKFVKNKTILLLCD